MKFIEIRKQISKKNLSKLHCVLMTEQLYNSIDFVLHWEKKAKERKRKKRLAGTKKVYWCIHQIQKTNRKLASRKISNNSQWGENGSEEAVAFLSLIHVFNKGLYHPSGLLFMLKQFIGQIYLHYFYVLIFLTLTINYIPKSTG